MINTGSKTVLIGNDRQRSILEMLDQQQKVKVTDLSKHFNVTDETIRRDLETLEQSNFLIRVHGGAMKPQHEGFELPMMERDSEHFQEKQAIAREALSIIEEGDIIALDASTTCLHLARAIQHESLTVITNSISVTVELANKSPHIQVILTGGYLRRESMSLVDFSTDKIIDDYHINKFFLSCSAVDLNWGLSESHEMQTNTKLRMSEIADELILLADRSKFQKKSLVHLLPLNKVNTIITDPKISQKIATDFETRVGLFKIAHE
ncbi:DeoR/GlpR transcriptional regulator [Salicibibacter cibarius]|uniref:DeoR/GlpR transcriptional regulator n=1 Tax=Salicibibacter cibarius TaxID=2743000 RepID=A0A7T6Z1F2_9BACI|nr:DeoR/GlpR family DNA-binding transcription regulator [Salicibibacter cibarius]QQK75038.1 DeoR/GlpR transcriptional regulator [Salicibibacter cibarius]